MIKIAVLVGIAAAFFFAATFFLAHELYKTATARKRKPSWGKQRTSDAFLNFSDSRDVPKQPMKKNIHDVIGQKETELERLKKELQVLCAVAPLLEEDLTPKMQAVQGGD